MQNLINKIVPESKIFISGQKLSVIAKAFYVTESCPDNEYVKIFLADHNVLVLSPRDEFICFGKDAGSVGIEPPFESKINYKTKDFRLINKDYQILTNLEFGSPLETEGEVEFWDYEGEDELISIGIIKRTGKRSDVVAKAILIEEIKVGNIYNHKSRGNS